MAPTLLSVVELGGYPDFTSLYRAAGFEVVASPSVRRALSLIKGRPPQVVVAEFNFQSDFRDRTSNLETLLAALQVRSPGTRTIVFYEPEHLSHLQRLTSRFSLFAALPFPVQESDLVTALHRAAAP